MTLWRVRTIFSGPAGTPWLSQMLFESTAGTPLQAATAVGVFWGAVDNFMKTTVSWQVDPLVYEVSVGDLQPVGVTSVAGPTGSGSSAADLLPPATQACLHWSTGFFVAGRELTGRTFIPGLSEDSCATDGSLNTTVRDAINTAAATLVGTANANFMINSRAHATAVNATAGSARTKFSVLRSRRD